MREVTGTDLWRYPADVIIITTNGTVKKDGCAVMGRGIARQAADRFPTLPRMLGQEIARRGNRVHTFPHFNLITFPVKWNWADPANLDLIRTSVRQLRPLLRADRTYAMVRPGCGNGRLMWARVRPLMVTLPSNLTIVEIKGA